MIVNALGYLVFRRLCLGPYRARVKSTADFVSDHLLAPQGRSREFGKDNMNPRKVNGCWNSETMRKLKRLEVRGPSILRP